MIIMLAIIAILLLFLVQAVRALNANFVKWANSDIGYKTRKLRSDNA
jgi:hypothetical protein